MYKPIFQPGDKVWTLSFGENGSKSLEAITPYGTVVNNVIVYSDHCQYSLQGLSLPRSEVYVAKDIQTLLLQINSYLKSRMPK